MTALTESPVFQLLPLIEGYKHNPNGTLNLAEVYSNKYGKLTTKSYYKTRRGTSQRIDDLKTSPRLTSVTDGASPLLIANIPKLFETAIENEICFNCCD